MKFELHAKVAEAPMAPGAEVRKPARALQVEAEGHGGVTVALLSETQRV